MRRKILDSLLIQERNTRNAARACATLTRRLDNALSSVHGLSFGDFVVHLANR